MGADYPVTEFWQVLRGDADGRDDASQITLLDSVGFAIEDFSALRYIHAKIEGSDFVQPIDIIADPADPPDLFGTLQRATGRRGAQGGKSGGRGRRVDLEIEH